MFAADGGPPDADGAAETVSIVLDVLATQEHYEVWGKRPWLIAALIFLSPFWMIMVGLLSCRHEVYLLIWGRIGSLGVGAAFAGRELVAAIGFVVYMAITWCIVVIGWSLGGGWSGRLRIRYQQRLSGFVPKLSWVRRDGLKALEGRHKHYTHL